MSDTLAGQAPKDTFGRLLQIANANAGADATLRTVRDGQGDATALSLATTHGDLLVQPANTTTARGLRARFGEVVNVKDYGAVGDGITVDSAAIQAAANAIPAAGGVLYFPPGVYKVNIAARLKSKTIVKAHGATFQPVVYTDFTGLADDEAPDIGYYIFANENFSINGTPDEEIEVWGGTFDYSNFGSPPAGGAHALHFLNVHKVKVGDGILIDGEDYIACRACDDVLVIGCSAYDFINCAWDFWWGCKNVRVIGCYSESATTVQHANFQCSGSIFPTGQVAENFIMQGCTMVHPTGSSPAYSSIFLDPFGTGNITRNVIIQGCQLHNVVIVARGYIDNVLIQGCQFFGGTANIPPIFSYVEEGNTPNRITVDNCVFTNPVVNSPNVAVIDLRGTNHRVTNNTIIGTSYSVNAVSLGTNGLQFSNSVEGTYGVNNVQSSLSRIVGGPGDGKGFGLRTASGSSMRWFVQDDDLMVLYGVNAAGDASRLAASWQQHSDSGVWSWGVEVRHNANLLRTVASNLTATGTVRTDALSLTAQFNNVTTVAAGTGVRLINRANGELIVRVRNGGANALNVYPFNSADQIDALGAGNPYSLAAGKVGAWCLTTNGQWYTVSVSP